jgi:hypothetical protein
VDTPVQYRGRLRSVKVARGIRFERGALSMPFPPGSAQRNPLPMPAGQSPAAPCRVRLPPAAAFDIRIVAHISLCT